MEHLVSPGRRSSPSSVVAEGIIARDFNFWRQDGSVGERKRVLNPFHSYFASGGSELAKRLQSGWRETALYTPGVNLITFCHLRFLRWSFPPSPRLFLFFVLLRCPSRTPVDLHSTRCIRQRRKVTGCSGTARRIQEPLGDRAAPFPAPLRTDNKLWSPPVDK